MTDYEMLIELQKEAIRLFMERQTDEPLTDFIAKYLLTNGVTVQKYGRWIKGKNGVVYCSECGRAVAITQSDNDFDEVNSDEHFCYYCGVKMSLEE